MKFYGRYDNPPPKRAVEFNSPSLTQQDWKDDCDVNTMIRRAIAGDASVLRHPTYIDALSCPESSHDAMNRLANAKTIWHDLPDKVRQTYGSPEALLSAIDAEFAKSQEPVNEEPKKSVSKQETSVAVKSTEPAPSNT